MFSYTNTIVLFGLPLLSGYLHLSDFFLYRRPVEQWIIIWKKIISKY